MFRPRIRAPRIPRVGAAQQSFRRGLLYVPPLTRFEAREGVPGLLSPAAFEISWTQYMQFLMDRINASVAETDFADNDPKEIVMKVARDPYYSSLFNYASMAHNNHFFFKTLARETTHMPARLQEELENSFGSIETLQREIIYTAMGMFGPGFVWLVKQTDRPGQPNSFRVLATYLAGSPYPGAHWRQQPADMNTAGPKLPEEEARQVYPKPLPANSWLELASDGSTGKVPAKAQFAPAGANLVPVLCVNTWEHVWLPDHGMYVQGVNGKLSYLNRWWHRIDWEVVKSLAGIDVRTLKTA